MIRTLRWAVIFFFSAYSCFGVDLEFSGRADNLYWSGDHRDTASGRTFQGTDLFLNLQGSITQELGDGLTFKGGLETDPILRNRAYSQLGFILDNFTLKFAPFLGCFNTTEKWFNPGLDALVEYTWPGLLFVRGGFLTTFAPVAKPGDYYLSSLTAGIGASLENGILSFNVVDKTATVRLPGNLTTVDASTKYWVDVEMFLKNVPFRWAIVTGYQLTNRSYIFTDSENSTPVHALLVGGRVSWDFGLGTTAFFQWESSLFQQGWYSTILAVPSDAVIFQATAGVRYHL